MLFLTVREFKVRYEMTVLIAWLLLGWALPSMNAQDQAESLNQVWNQAQTAFAKGEYKTAHDWLLQVVKQIPFEPSSRILLARCQMRLDQREKAIENLAIATSKGWEDSDGLKKTDEFRALKDDVKFQRIVEQALKNRKRAFVLHEPPSTKPEQPAPLIVLFHGRGELPDTQLHFWVDAADKNGYRVLALKGPRRVGPVYAWEKQGARKTWQLDSEAIAEMTQQSIAKVCKSHNVSKIVLAGFSQGGVAASEMLRRNLTPQPVGAVVFASAFPTQDEVAKDSGPSIPKLPLIVHCGKDDPWRDGNRYFVGQVRKLGGTVEYKEWQSLGHRMPPKHSQVIIDSVQKILNGRVGKSID